MAGHRQWRYDERGILLSSPLTLLAAAAVVLAGAGFLVTGRDAVRRVEAARPVSAVTEAPAPTSDATRQRPPRKRAPEREVKKRTRRPAAARRTGVYVEVYNNSGVGGLAGSTAERIAAAGWQVVGSDNWYGTIPASTVYYPARLREQARLLANDLGISRLLPAVSPMRFDRLTVILTADYS